MTPRKLQIRTQAEELAKAKVKALGMRGWHDEVKNVLAPKECDEVMETWRGMNGSSAWIDAFNRWFNA